MRFPTDPVALRLLNADTLSMREKELRIGAAFDTGLEQVPPRRPSQLYEALAEGVLLGFSYAPGLTTRCNQHRLT